MSVRAFFALDLPAAMLDHAESVRRALERAPGASRARWARRGSLHLTLAFLGDLDAEVAASLGLGALALCPTDPPQLQLGGLGAFPQPHAARVLFLDVVDEGAVARLAAAVATLAEAAGIPREKRPFHPHLTLARFRTPTDVGAWIGLTKVRPLVAPAAAFALYESRQGPEGAVYVPLARRAWEAREGA